MCSGDRVLATRGEQNQLSGGAAAESGGPALPFVLYLGVCCRGRELPLPGQDSSTVGEARQQRYGSLVPRAGPLPAAPTLEDMVTEKATSLVQSNRVSLTANKHILKNTKESSDSKQYENPRKSVALTFPPSQKSTKITVRD